MFTDDLRETSDPEIIMSNKKTFYGALYSSRRHETESECVDSLDIPKLSEDERNSCEGKLKTKEFWDSFDSMDANKSPLKPCSNKEFTHTLYYH